MAMQANASRQAFPDSKFLYPFYWHYFKSAIFFDISITKFEQNPIWTITREGKPEKASFLVGPNFL
jgi:hypothetical protein